MGLPESERPSSRVCRQCTDECRADSPEGVWARHLSVVQLDVSKDGARLRFAFVPRLDSPVPSRRGR